MSSDAPPSIARPNPDEEIIHDGKAYKAIQEGLAYILVPPNAKLSQDPSATLKEGEEAQKVFYNPIQQFNRDLSVLAIKAFGKDLCERRRVKFEAGRGKREGKKGGKGKGRGNKRDREEDGGEGDGAAKVRKGVDGERVALENGNAEAETRQGAANETEGAAGDVVMDGTGVAAAGETAKSETNTNGEGNAENKSDGRPPQKEWKPNFRILDALSATGLRALRYAQEIPFATAITANDMDRKAVESINLNIKHNGLADRVTATTGNAIGYMYGVAYPPTYTHGPDHVSGKYDVIDLDPYGTAAPFIDAALQALNDGGLLCVTCTDSGVFASCGYSEKTYALYGGMPIKGPHSHEGGLRLIMHSIASSAAKYGIAVEPLLSLSIDFYVRLFIRVRRSPADVKFLAGKTMVVYDCDAGCGAWTTQALGRNQRVQGKGPNINWKHTIAQGPGADRFCEHCGSKTHVAGPMWAGPLHNPAFVERILLDVKEVDKKVYQTTARIEGMLDTALEELFAADFEPSSTEAAPAKTNTEKAEAETLIPKIAPDVLDREPFFFIPSALAKVLHCQAPPEAAVKGALRHAGYYATRSHCKPGSIKTTAPWSAIWEIMREWVRQRYPVKEGALREGSAGWRIMQAARKVEEGSDETGKKNDEAEKKAGGQSEANGKESDSSMDIVTEKTIGASEGKKDGAAQGQQDGTKRMKVVFDEALGRDRGGKRLVRYQQNPRENWGPMARAK